MPDHAPARAVIITVISAFIASIYMAYVPGLNLTSALFLFSASVVQTVFLSLPVLIFYHLYRRTSPNSKSARVSAVLVYLSGLFVILFILANYKLREMYGFYFNYFVLNLLITPGGVEAMGVSSATNITLAVVVLIVGVIFVACIRFIPWERVFPQRVSTRKFVVAFVALFFLQASWYAFSEYRYDRIVLQVADRIIWYIPVTARGFLENMGVEIQRPEGLESDLVAGGGSIDYPQASTEKLSKPYNVVWLVAESWRADTLTPEIMPNVTSFAQKSQRFLEHYSGGNGTRMGMFSQFYGIYGSYWFDFLNEGRPPLLMERIKNNDYSMMAYTSSRFSYPEFDKTIFAGFSEDQLQSYTEGDGWERDRKDVDDMLNFIESAKAPFFSFMFFESAHANYYFPPESVIEPNYLKDFNYLTVDIEESIDLIHNRYINAVHHLDSQLGRVLSALEAQGHLDDTIVIVTGDHGEEFMENGRWGHNSTFSQEQIRVPLLVFVPGEGAGSHTTMSSHLDLPATVLAALGDTTDPATYSYGTDLLAADFSRNYTVISDWHGNTLVTPDVKMVFSKKGAVYDDVTTNIDDDPVDLSKVGPAYKDALGAFARELSRFYR